MGRTFTAQERTWDGSGRERKERGRGRSLEGVPGKPVAARGLVNGWMALAPDGMERSGRFSRYLLQTLGGTVYYLLRRSEMEISSRRTAQKHTEAKTPPSRQAIPVGKLISAPDSRIPLL